VEKAEAEVESVSILEEETAALFLVPVLPAALEGSRERREEET
jgi:hypothetical protein